MTKKAEENTLTDSLRVVFYHRRLFLVAASLFAIVAMLVSQYVPLKYTATTVFERRSDAAIQDIAEKTSESFKIAKLTLRQELAGKRAAKAAVDEFWQAHGHSLGSGPDAAQVKACMVKDVVKNTRIKWTVRSRWC